MPIDKRKVNPTEKQKVTNRYQDVNKNEVKFQWILSTKTINRKWRY